MARDYNRKSAKVSLAPIRSLEEAMKHLGGGTQLAPDPLNDTANNRPVVDQATRAPDPMMSVLYENREPESVLAKVKVGSYVTTMPSANLATNSINYLRYRVAPSQQISDIQYVAAVRYREDRIGLTAIGSNTAATIQHMQSLPRLTAEDRERLRKGEPFMKGGDDSRGTSDVTSRILASAFRARRVYDKLDKLDRSVLEDLLVNELTVGRIAQRWAWPPEAASVVVRMALWRLASISMVVDAEYAAWVSLHRENLDETIVDPDDLEAFRDKLVQGLQGAPSKFIREAAAMIDPDEDEKEDRTARRAASRTPETGNPSSKTPLDTPNGITTKRKRGPKSKEPKLG